MEENIKFDLELAKAGKPVEWFDGVLEKWVDLSEDAFTRYNSTVGDFFGLTYVTQVVLPLGTEVGLANIDINDLRMKAEDL